MRRCGQKGRGRGLSTPRCWVLEHVVVPQRPVDLNVSPWSCQMEPGNCWRRDEAREPSHHEDPGAEVFGQHPALASFGEIERRDFIFVRDFGGRNVGPVPRQAPEVEHLAGGAGVEGDALSGVVGVVEQRSSMSVPDLSALKHSAPFVLLAHRTFQLALRSERQPVESLRSCGRARREARDRSRRRAAPAGRGRRPPTKGRLDPSLRTCGGKRTSRP